MEGSILKQLIEAIGLPESFVKPKLMELFLQNRIDPETATLADLRTIVSNLLCDSILKE